MKKGWQTKTLGEACQFSNGLWKGEKPPFVNVGVIRNTNFNKEGRLDYSDIAYLDVEAKKYQNRHLQFGDIILEKSGGGPKQPVGRIALFDKTVGEFSFSNFTAVLRVRNHHELDFHFLHKFLYWTYVSGVTERIQSHSTGIRNLDGDAYKAIQITFPSLPEQQRLVHLLDEAFDHITTAKATVEKNLQNARELFESYLEEVFTQKREGWHIKPLQELCKDFRQDIVDGPFGSDMQRKDYRTEGVPVLKIQNVKPFAIELKKMDYISLKKFHDLRRHSYHQGDIVMTKLGKPLGASAIVEGLDDGVIVADLVRIRAQLIDTKYLCYHLNSPKTSAFINSMQKGTTRPRVRLSVVRELPIFVPSAEEQQTIVTKLDSLSTEIQRLTAVYQRKLATLDELKMSLLHHAFNGEL